MKYFLLFPMLLFLSIGSNPSLEAQSVIRGPYLQQVGKESIIIRWRTGTNATSKVWYGSTPGNLTQTSSNNNATKEHSIKLTGLLPNTKYYYAIGTTTNQLAGGDSNHYFKTSPVGAIEETINIWVLGDAGKGGAPQRDVRDAFYDHHGNEPIDFTLLLGDNAYADGTDAQYQDTWFEDMYEDRLIHTTMFSCYGNHDAFSANSSNETGVYFDIFDHPKNGELGGVPSGHEGYYSFDYGDIHVISLNSYDANLSTNGAQYQWLEDDLSANEKGWTIVILHYPPHDARNNYSDSNQQETDIRENYNPLLEQYGVDLVLGGHSHDYQRSFLIDNYYGKSNQFNPSLHGVDMGDGQLDGDGAYEKSADGKGTIYMVSGSAGSRAGLGDDLSHPAMYYTEMIEGSVRLQITYDELFAEFITLDGVVNDYFTFRKELPPVGSTVFHITNPLQEGYTQPQPIIVTHEFLDSIDELSQVNFYVNDVLVSEETVYPFFLNYNIPSNGDYEIKAKALTVSGAEYSDKVSFHVGSISLCKSVSSSSNDAEEKESGFVSVTSSDLELTVDGSNNQKIGLRFIGLNIPEGATIQSANIQFTTYNTNNADPCDLTIYGEAAADADSYSSSSFSISDRNKTQAFVNWSPPAWETIDEAGPDQRTPDLKSIVEEILNLPGYESENPIAFIVTGSGRRSATAQDGSSAEAPALCLEYTAPYPPDSDGDGTSDSEDLCAGGLEVGALCNDFNPATYNDTIGPNCNCVGIPFDCPILLADIGTPCSDGTAATYDDVIDANCNCTGIPFDCPIYLADIGTPCDDNNENTINDVLTSDCNCVGLALGNITTVTIPVVMSSDDAEQKSSGSVSLTSGDLELVDDNGLQTVGVRFQNVAIPSGAVIVQSYIQFTTDATAFVDPCVLQVYGEYSANPVTFVNSSQNISNRPKTMATQTWSPPHWNSNDESGADQRTPNLKEIITEIIQQSNYNSGNAMAFIIEGTGRRRAISYDGDPSGAPELVIQYAYLCIDDDGDGICNPEDNCPQLAGLAGDPCNDNNPGTYNDVITPDCQCIGTAYDCPALQMNTGAPCDDANPLTFNDAINANCQCEGTFISFDCTNLSLNIGDACDDNNANTFDDVVDANCNCTGVSSDVQTVSIPITLASDDAEQKSSGSVSTTSSDLEMMLDGTDVQLIGLRFQHPGIPNGATILNAYVQFTCDETNDLDPTSISIYGEANNNPTTFLKLNNNISDRLKTNAFVEWQPTEPWFANEKTEKQRTTDISPVIQELVNRPGYRYNNAISLLLEGYGRRVATSFDGNKFNPALLVVTFSFVCIDDDGDGICNNIDACPQSADNPGTPCDDGDPETFGDEIDANCNCTGTVPMGMSCSTINMGTDDAEERSNGTVKVASSDLELVVDNMIQTVGLRFTGLSIPAGVTIASAPLQFTVDEAVNINPCELMIYGEIDNNAATFSETPFNVSSRLKTNTSVAWLPEDWTESGLAGSAQSVDVSPILQEIVNRPDFIPGQPVSIIIEGIGRRVAVAFDGNPGYAPELCVEYELGSNPFSGSAIEYENQNVVSEEESKSGLSIFPNPASEYISLVFDASRLEKKVDLQIMDVNGKVLLRQKHEVAKGDTSIRVDGLSLSNGVYFVRMKSSGSLLVGEFVIVN